MASAADPVAHWSWAQVCRRRLERHGLASAFTGAAPADVVRAMGGTHAQVLSAAELAIGLRTAGLTRADVRAALWDERSLVKTFGPRGTVHLLPAADLPAWVAVLSAVPYVDTSPASIRMTPEQVEAVMAAIDAALTDADLTVDELTEAIVDRAGPWAGDPVMEAFQGKWPRWRLVHHLAGQRGVLCFGPNRGRQVTYTSPRRWLGGLATVGEADALRGIVEQHLRAYGPTTPQRFAHFLAAPARWAVGVFESLAGHLEPVDVEGTTAWVVRGDAEPPEGPPRGVRLLPYFDPYAYAVGNQRDRLYPGAAATRVAGNFQVLLVDGVVAGLWHQRRSGRRLDVTVEPLVRLGTRRSRELDRQVARVGEVLEATPSLTIGTVTVGSHA